MPDHPPLHRIAVIGGGASAALLAAALPAGAIQLDIYDRTGRFARGIAYSTTNRAHLLNVRAGNMSALADDKTHFARWAAAHGYDEGDFVPRALYGDYLEEILSTAAQKFTINLIKADVISVQRDVTEYSVNGKNYDDVVVATGNVMPLGPRVTGNINGYYAQPWSLTTDDIKQARHIALIGTGLSAVDALLTLSSFGYQGQVSMISRRTWLPATHTAPASWPHPPLSAEDADKPLSHLIGMIRLHVREAAADNIPWQAVIDSLRSVTNPLWQNFSDAQKGRFTRRLLTLWNIHRHRMAPSIAADVQTWRDAGRLHFIRDSVQDITAGPVVNGTKATYPFDIVINCMGYRYQEAGRAYDYSHAIGPARFGPLFETTAIPEIRQQAKEIAEALSA